MSVLKLQTYCQNIRRYSHLTFDAVRHIVATLSIWKPDVSGVAHEKLNFRRIGQPWAIKCVTYTWSSWFPIIKPLHQCSGSDDMYAHAYTKLQMKFFLVKTQTMFSKIHISKWHLSKKKVTYGTGSSRCSTVPLACHIQKTNTELIYVLQDKKKLQLRLLSTWL